MCLCVRVVASDGAGKRSSLASEVTPLERSRSHFESTLRSNSFLHQEKQRERERERGGIMATFSSAEYGKADFVLLDQLTEEAFMHNLKLRFQKGKIYSYIGGREKREVKY